MLTREVNEYLTRTDAGTPMGTLRRRFWFPGFFSSEVPEPDCPPFRVRLLGEGLVAYRDTSSRVRLLGDHCPHRGASLFFGRNEEQGLRCVYVDRQAQRTSSFADIKGLGEQDMACSFVLPRDADWTAAARESMVAASPFHVS